MYASYAGIEIPKVFSIDTSYKLIGDRERTLGGKLRQDSEGVKRTWTLQCRPVTHEEASLILDFIRGSHAPEGAFWLKEFEEKTILVRPNVEGIVEKIVPFSDDGVWHDNGRQLTFVFEEV